MMKNNIDQLRIAGNSYRLKDDFQIAEKVLAYIQQRIVANQKEIEKLLQLKKETVTYIEIQKAINQEIAKDISYKGYKQMTIHQENFISASLLMPIGIVAVEAYDTIEVIRYLIKAIKTRNAIAISDAEYDEQSVKFLILEIIKEALKKFNINENLIMILPYEECFYSYFDKVIYTYNKQGKKLRQNGYEQKKHTEQKYIYIENSELKEIALHDNSKIEKEILQGSMEEAIEKINETYAMSATIYTKNAENAYRFINLVNSKNIFVNTGLENTKEPEISPYELYTYRNIVLPIPTKNDKENKQKKLDINLIEPANKEETSLQIINKSVFEKIKDFLRRLFS